jgi:hypothetical protein
MLANPIAVIVVYDFDLTHSRVSKVRVGQKLSYMYFPRLSYVLQTFTTNAKKAIIFHISHALRLHMPIALIC